MNRPDTAMPTIEIVMCSQDTVSNLTNNQIDLLIKIAQGKTNARIADEFCLQEQTVKNRVNKLMKKLNADNRVHIATFACLGYPPTEAQLRTRWRDLSRDNGRH